MFDDLLGGNEEAPKKRGRPSRKRADMVLKNEDEAWRHEMNLSAHRVHRVSNGVTVTWLAKFFRMQPYHVKKALKDCPILRSSDNGGEIYDGPTAAAYLIDPARDLNAYLSTIKPDKLPEKLRETYWNAKIKEAKFRAMAGELWPTQSVMHVFGETFKTIKNTTRLWADTVEETQGLTDEQRLLINRLANTLLDKLHHELVEHAKSNETESFLSELDADEAAES